MTGVDHAEDEMDEFDNLSGKITNLVDIMQGYQTDFSSISLLIAGAMMGEDLLCTDPGNRSFGRVHKILNKVKR